LDPVCKVGKVEEGVVVVAVEKGWRCDERTRREEKRRWTRREAEEAAMVAVRRGEGSPVNPLLKPLYLW
jgi:hypothetical protein